MTPERLREIAERHTTGEEWIPTARVVDLPVAQVAHADRGDLLNLLRELLNTTSKHTLPDGSVCSRTGAW